METIKENRYLKIVANKSFESIKDELMIYLNTKLKIIMNFFNLPYIHQIAIYLYDNKDEFYNKTNYPYKIGPLAGAYNILGARVYAELNNINKKELINCIAHELAHILYQKYIREKGIKNRIIWFEEGLVRNLSGEFEHLLIKENLVEFLNKNIYNDDKEIPDITFLNKHGNTFGTFIDNETNKYNGYTWSYLMVRFLLEQTSKETFDIIMRDKKRIEEIGQNLPKETYNYFKKNIKTR